MIEFRFRPRRLTLPWLSAVVVLIAALSAAALEVPLTYEDYSSSGSYRGYRPYGRVFLNKGEKLPAGDWILPELSEHPVYCLAPFGDGKQLIVLDKRASSDFYDTLFFDANANNDLTDDPVIRGNRVISSSSSSYRRNNFQDINTTIVVDGKELPYSFRLYINCNLVDPDKPVWHKKNLINLRLYCYTNCAYTGIIRHKKRSYNIILSDSNANGLFSDRFKVRSDIISTNGQIYTQGDKLYLTSGEKTASYYDRFILGDQLYLGGTLFSVSVSTSESKLTLKPVTKPLKKLKLAKKPERITLYTKDNKHCVMLFRPEETVELPEGEYGMYKYELYRNDEQKDSWLLRATATKESPFVKLGGSDRAVLQFGEPFTPLVEVPQWELDNFKRSTSAGKKLRLLLNIVGSGGEGVSYLSHVSGNKTKVEMSAESPSYPKEPIYNIINSKGELKGSGSFKYG